MSRALPRRYGRAEATLSANERAALASLRENFAYERQGNVWHSTYSMAAIPIANGVMQRLARRGLVTFVGVIEGTRPAITGAGLDALKESMR